MNTFSDDAEFLARHTELIVLDGDRPALVAVAPAYQGRVMTSSPTGPEGPSLGWLNREFIQSGRRGMAFDNYGGEERFWLGPEGGQFGLWFKNGDPFDMGHWQTPPGLNEGHFAITSLGRGSVAMAAHFEVTNYSGTTFEVAVKRIIDVLSREQVAADLGTGPRGELSCAAFQSTNTLANVGENTWKREGGLLSVWTLGQFSPLPRGMVIAPFLAGDDAKLGPPPNGEYFGPVPPERFRICDGYLLFRCDGKYRSKLGVSSRRAKNVLGSYDPDAQVLTIVQFNLPPDAAGLSYVNSLWEIQQDAFAGDAVNSYNDGEEAPGAGQMGPFYEIETSSPAAELSPGQAITHVHRTFHFAGELENLNALSQRVLGVDLNKIEFPGRT